MMAKLSANNQTLPLLVLLLVLLLSPSHDDKVTLGGGGLVVMVDARTCESQSHGFQGKCLSNHNCGLVCRNEGFTDGWCRGLRQRCFCTKTC